jgi:hypothetical protein
VADGELQRPFDVRPCACERLGCRCDDGLVAIASADVLGGADPPRLELTALATAQHSCVEHRDRLAQLGPATHGPPHRGGDPGWGRHADAPDPERVAKATHQVAVVGAQMDASHGPAAQRERPFAREEPAEER